jgi:hypothetical protein
VSGARLDALAQLEELADELDERGYHDLASQVRRAVAAIARELQELAA